MLIRLIRKHKSSHQRFLDYDLVDVLRAISVQDGMSIVTHSWLVKDLIFFAYNDDFKTDCLKLLLPELELKLGQTQAVTNGERLLERSAIIHQLEEGFFLRVADNQSEVVINTEYRLFGGPSHFQASNVDLEIRCNESPFEVVTEDKNIIDHLQCVFATTEIEP